MVVIAAGRVSFVKLEHFLKHVSPMLVTVAGSVSSLRVVHSSKAP
tara:strand:+ start:558 stop:692 length:135 start_codon:yes stop_codon:yes gene_type:complete